RVAVTSATVVLTPDPAGRPAPAAPRPPSPGRPAPRAAVPAPGSADPPATGPPPPRRRSCTASVAGPWPPARPAGTAGSPGWAPRTGWSRPRPSGLTYRRVQRAPVQPDHPGAGALDDLGRDRAPAPLAPPPRPLGRRRLRRQPAQRHQQGPRRGQPGEAVRQLRGA